MNSGPISPCAKIDDGNVHIFNILHTEMYRFHLKLIGILGYD